MIFRTSSGKALAAIIVCTFLGGGIPVFTKIGLQTVPPILFTLLRMILAGIILLPLLMKNRPKFDTHSWQIILLSLLASANILFFTIGLPKTTAIVSQMMYAAVPLIAAVLSAVLLHQKIGLKKTFGILTGFSGVMIIILMPAFGKGNIFQGELIGNLIIMIAVISFSFYSVLSKPFQKTYTPLQITAFFIITTIISQSILASTELHKVNDVLSRFSYSSAISLLYVGIVTAVYYLLYQYAIKHASPVIASLTLYLQPVSTYLWASALLGEQLTTGFVVGAVLTLMGVTITIRSK